LTWSASCAGNTLIPFSRIVRVRLQLKEMHMDSKKWTKRWNSWVAPTRVPGLWKRKGGGFLVRARVVEVTTGRMKEIRKVLPLADEAEAFKWLTDERARVKAGLVFAPQHSARFGDFAVSLLERKIATGDIKSKLGQEKWTRTLKHLIGGTGSSNGGPLVAGFGEFYLDQIRVAHVEAWKAGIGALIVKGKYAPTTANSWLAILRVIMKAAKRQLELPHLATEGVEDFDTSGHVTYTEEEPNSLPPERVPEFLAGIRDLFPQHFAMTYLGLATGLRPSSLRPLRRRGSSPDVLWDQNRILVRRSQTRGDEVMNTTKQKTRYSIEVPEEVMKTLRWHVDTQLVTPEQKESDLLFPSLTGGYRAASVLTKPFVAVTEEMRLGYSFTPRGMRRTFNDLARAASIEAIVTRSISGHLTERMQEHYSTVRGPEQRDGIARVVHLMTTAVDADGGGTRGGMQASVGGTQTRRAG
jgi:integrase